MISQQTATDIALIYREITVSEKLLAQIQDQIDRTSCGTDIRDAFGRPLSGLEFGIRSGDNSMRLFNVQWSLAKPVIEAHIAGQRAQLSALQEKAKSELAL